MKFGYFFIGLQYSIHGQATATVQIRPMEAQLQDLGVRINITVPIHTASSALPLSEVAAQALQSAQQLLPESALSAWAQGLEGQPMAQPCLPQEALEAWGQ